MSDASTGLMWMQDDSGAGMNWESALSYCEELDDEFGADCKVLLDPSAVDYLDIESLCYLGDELVRILK